MQQMAEEACEKGHPPGSEAGRDVAKTYLEGWAQALGVEPNQDYWEKMRRKHILHHPNTERYWALIFCLQGVEIKDPGPVSEWITEAVHAFLETV